MSLRSNRLLVTDDPVSLSERECAEHFELLLSSRSVCPVCATNDPGAFCVSLIWLLAVTSAGTLCIIRVGRVNLLPQ